MPKTILVDKTSNAKSRGGSNVYITVYGVPTQLVREDKTILDRMRESMKKILSNIELTSEFSWTTSASNHRQSTAVVRGRRSFNGEKYYLVPLIGDGDILLDVNVLSAEANLKGPISYYSLPGQSTGERRMILKVLRQEKKVSVQKDFTVHALSVRLGKRLCSVIAVYGTITSFNPKAGNYVIKQLNSLLDIPENCFDSPVNTYMYSAGSIVKEKADQIHYDFLRDHGEHYVGNLFDDYSRDNVYVMTKKLDNFASRGLTVIQNIRTNNQKSGPSKKGSGAQ